MLSKKIILICSECFCRNYHYKKNRFDSKRLELRKYCSTCNKPTIHKENK